jgi:hypothetical protein
VRLKCPVCFTESEQPVAPLQGVHIEYYCTNRTCGVLLQGDVSTKRGRIGERWLRAPTACSHLERKEPLAQLPRLSR